MSEPERQGSLLPEPVGVLLVSLLAVGACGLMVAAVGASAGLLVRAFYWGAGW